MDKEPLNLILESWKMVALVALLFTSAIQCREEESHLCDVFTDIQYKGYVVDCSRRHFTWKDLPLLGIEHATTLILSHNDMLALPNNSLTNFPELRSLECSDCSLTILDVDSLRGLNNLQNLALDHNGISYKEHAFRKGCFGHVSKLKYLNIMHNSNSGYTLSNYSQFLDIFSTLPELRNLSIDAFDDLRLGEEFTNFAKLRTLRVNCESLNSISNDSLEGFENSTVTNFEMLCGERFIPPYAIGFDAFQNLPQSVSHFAIHNLQIGNRNALHLFKTLVGRRMDTIILNSTFSSWYAPFHQKLGDGFVTTDALKYLAGICVKHLHWYGSRIVAIETDAPMTETWQKCLVTVCFETDPIIMLSNTIMFYKAIHLKKLRQIVHMVRGNKLIKHFWKHKLYRHDIEYQAEYNNAISYSKSIDERIWMKRHFYNRKSFDFQVKTNNHFHEDEYHVKNLQKEKKNMLDYFVRHRPGDIGKNILDKEISLTRIYDQSISTNSKLPSQRNNVTSLVITSTLPPELRELIFDGYKFVSFDHTYKFRPNNMTSISITNSEGGLKFDGALVGLDKVESIDFQGSRLEVFPTFYTEIPSLKKLILRRTHSTLNSDVLHGSFQYIPLIEYLDIAENGLTFLRPDSFRANPNLKYLCLASNIFSTIPFDLNLTPKLEILDLRGNVIPELSEEERQSIDRHIKRVHNFTILLSHNELSCSCASKPFVAWLHRNARHFDHQGNYSCLSEEESTYTWTGFFDDPVGFHRKCRGYFSFLWTLILACALLTSYMALFLGMKHKTQIISKVVQIITPGFRLKTRQEFFYDVFIGYSHQEGSYVKNILLRYLEETWGLTTFVHQRDLRHDPLLLSTALRESWRTLLLITENFLDNYDMAYNIMKVACFFVSPYNPHNVVVIVEEDVQHRIPDYVLQVVDDDNIIIIPKLQGFLDYHVKETLKTRLL